MSTNQDPNELGNGKRLWMTGEEFKARIEAYEAASRAKSDFPPPRQRTVQLTPQKRPSLPAFESLVVMAVDSMLRRGVCTRPPGASWNPATSRPGSCRGGLSRRLVPPEQSATAEASWRRRKRSCVGIWLGLRSQAGPNRRAPKVTVTREGDTLCQKGCYPLALVFY